MKKQRKVGRPRKSCSVINGVAIPQNQTESIPLKRGRGRPRKYPIAHPIRSNRPPVKLVIRRPIAVGPPEPIEISAPVGWGGQRARQTLPPRIAPEAGAKDGSRSPSAVAGFPSGSPSAADSDRAVSESNATSVPDTGSGCESDCSPEQELDWYTWPIEIPGPIPDLEDLIKDQNIYGAPDFLSDLPDHWD